MTKNVVASPYHLSPGLLSSINTLRSLRMLELLARPSHTRILDKHKQRSKAEHDTLIVDAGHLEF